MHDSTTPQPPMHVGYILKQYPRLSETFILNEILGLEAREIDVSIFSLRHATEGRFHPSIASVRGAVHYSQAPDKSAFLGAFQALPDLRSDRLPQVFDFVDRLPSERRARLLLDAIRIAELALQDDIQHLHAHFLTVAAHTAFVVHLLTGIPFSVTAHAKDIYRYGVDWDVASRIAGAADAVVTVCDANAAFLAHRLDGASANVVRIYNGLGPQNPPSRISARDPGLVLGVGRLVEKKGFDILLHALAEARDRAERLHCVLIGDGDCRDSLEALAQDLDIDDIVTFAGSLPQDQVSQWMRRAEVLAAPCRVGEDGNQDALPTVLLEALGAGLPSVTCAVAGIPEIVTDGIEGQIVPSADPIAFAEALVRILGDEELRTRLAAAGPPKLLARFDRADTIEKLITVFASRELAQ